MSTILTMQLSDIRIDGGTQPRERLCEDTVADYSEAMKAGDQFPPIVVFCDGSDNWLADGFHRFHAACKAGIAELPADVRTGTRQDALWHLTTHHRAPAVHTRSRRPGFLPCGALLSNRRNAE